MYAFPPLRTSILLRTAIISAGFFLGGGLTDDSDDGDGDGGAALRTRTAIVGAHDNPTIGSSIDLDFMEVYTYANAA